MARFKKMRRYTRKAAKAYKRYGRSKGSTNVFTIMAAGAVYGVARPMIEKYIPASVSGFAGGYGDELLLGTAGYMAAKGKLSNNAFIKDLGKAVLVIESARVANALTAGMLNKESASNTWEY